MKISLIILTMNEIVGLKNLFDCIPLDVVDEVFAVDGGSSDGTVDFLIRNGIVVHFQCVKGRGEAFRVAFRKAKGDALIFFSPDGNEDPADISKFRLYFEQGCDMVIATRMVNGARNEDDHLVFKWRKWANKVFNLMANTTWNRGPFVTDTINGFRGITKRAWKILSPEGSGYTIEYQSSIRAFKNGFIIAEFPTIEGIRIDGRKGSPSISTGLAFINTFWKELIR